MSHELVAFPNGSFSVKPLCSDEAMHSHIGPWQEAELIYVSQSRLAERLARAGGPLVVFDLGLGIAANALAAIECFSGCAPQRDLHLVSFEKHLDGLKLALSRAERFPWVARHRETLEELLARREWRSPRIRWQLREGDFLAAPLAELPPAEVMYFDFYSPKACPELWDVGCFEKLRAAGSPHAALFTYGASTAARSAMLLAGWNVGTGLPTSSKAETTVASRFLPDLKRPLGGAWLTQLSRSEKPLPASVAPAHREQALGRIRRHPQFEGEK
jgi:tRNA U34 5-methylaminomethyl-2-thiouridine-forming methyltransferase MnmC